MNTKWKVVLSIMLLITAICAVFITLVQQQHDDKVAAIIAGKSESASLLAGTLLTELSNKYQNRARAMANPKVSLSREQMIHAFAERDRTKLLQLSTPLFSVLKRENPYFSTLGWVLPDNHVFLRNHDPEKFGAAVTLMRPDVAAVNLKKKQLSGFEAGYMGLQYRIVQPIFYHDKYLGALQIGIKASIIVDALKNKLKTISGIAILNKECDVVKVTNIPKIKGATHTIRARDISPFHQSIVDQLDWNRNQQRITLEGRSHIILNVLPVSNFQDEKLGVFFVALDISSELAQKQQLLISILVLSGFLLLFSFLILHFSYGGLVQKILNLNQSLEENNRELENRVQLRTAKLQEGEKRLQNILDQSPLGILIADNKTMRPQYANPALCKMLGYSKDELENLDVYSLHPPEEHNHVSEEFKTQALGEKTLSANIPFQRKDGALCVTDIISAPIELDGLACTVSFIVDQTKRKDLESRLHRAQKMEAIGLMAGGVAHDLNNILAGIVSYPELLLLKVPESSELRKPIEAIRESGKRAATVVADLLTVARGVASSRRPHNIHLLISEYLHSPEFKYLTSLHPGVSYLMNLEAVDNIISCSPIHIKKTIMNLVTNAMEAVGDKGNILLSTCNQTIEKDEIEEDGIPPGSYVVFTVQDDGPGISQKDLEQIFEPFYTRKVMGQSGTGLGLAVVWNTVQDHNGRIFVKSSEKGTHFHLYFPVSKENCIVQNKNDKTVKSASHSEHILVVDDEPQLRDIACQMLRTFGYIVDSVCSGELAIKYVKENPVDLLVIDMLMEPGMNGRQTYAEILKLYPDQKAIIVSGFSESDDVKATLELGAGGFIKKPYSMDQVGKMITEVLHTEKSNQ